MLVLIILCLLTNLTCSREIVFGAQIADVLQKRAGEDGRKGRKSRAIGKFGGASEHPFFGVVGSIFLWLKKHEEESIKGADNQGFPKFVAVQVCQLRLDVLVPLANEFP